jgi:hypothetical protein
MLLGSRGYPIPGEGPYVKRSAKDLHSPDASIAVTAGRERGITRVQRPMPLIGIRPS